MNNPVSLPTISDQEQFELNRAAYFAGKDFEKSYRSLLIHYFPKHKHIGYDILIMPAAEVPVELDAYRIRWPIPRRTTTRHRNSRTDALASRHAGLLTREYSMLLNTAVKAFLADHGGYLKGALQISLIDRFEILIMPVEIKSNETWAVHPLHPLISHPSRVLRYRILESEFRQVNACKQHGEVSFQSVPDSVPGKTQVRQGQQECVERWNACPS